MTTVWIGGFPFYLPQTSRRGGNPRDVAPGARTSPTGAKR